MSRGEGTQSRQFFLLLRMLSQGSPFVFGRGSRFLVGHRCPLSRSEGGDICFCLSGSNEMGRRRKDYPRWDYVYKGDPWSFWQDSIGCIDHFPHRPRPRPSTFRSQAPSPSLLFLSTPFRPSSLPLLLERSPHR